MWSDLGHLAVKRERNPFLPRIVLIEPWRRFFQETLEVNPWAIRKALLHGCAVASALAATKVPRDNQFVRIRSYFTYNDENACRSLQNMINAAPIKTPWPFFLFWLVATVLAAIGIVYVWKRLEPKDNDPKGPLMAVRREGADHLSRKTPPGRVVD